MEAIVKKNGDESADFELPNGCALCGGPVSVRISPQAARSVCIGCRWVARATVAFRPEGIEVMYGPTAIA